MPMTINTNVSSLNAQRNLTVNQSSLALSMQRLSSGLRVNSAKDDAAGLAIANRMDSQVRGSNVAIRNANDAISMFQTAEGAMGKVQDNLQRIRELAVQSANGAISDSDRTNLQSEVNQLTDEIQRVVQTSSYNGINLFDAALTKGATTGLAKSSVQFQVGANASDTITVSSNATPANGGFDLTGLNSYSATARAATANGPIDISTAGNATTALGTLTTDIDTISSARATAGALQSRFEAVVAQLQVYSENTSAAKGRIMDADFAAETANLSRSQVLQQAGSAMVAQANAAPQQVLGLLRNL